MKKFYAFAAAAVTALSMNAQNGAPLYLTGNCTEPSWAPESPLEFTYADGVYTIELTNAKSFKVSTAFGSWDEFNTGAIAPEAPVAKEQLGTAVALVAGDRNIETPWIGDYKVVIAGDLSTITLTTDTPEPEPTIAEVYVRGGMNDWGVSDEWKFQTTDGVNYSLECAIPTGVEFKIGDAEWGNLYGINYSAGEEIILEDDGTCTGTWRYDIQVNTTVAEDFEGTISFSLADKTAEGLPVKFAAKGTVGIDSVVAEENAPAVYYNLQGVKVANPGNGVYVVRQGNKVSKVLVK